jgi:hypothetical protein
VRFRVKGLETRLNWSQSTLKAGSCVSGKPWKKCRQLSGTQLDMAADHRKMMSAAAVRACHQGPPFHPSHPWPIPAIAKRIVSYQS